LHIAGRRTADGEVRRHTHNFTWIAKRAGKNKTGSR
jgi:hypothetical protein